MLKTVPPATSNCRGFTLIELMIVVAIIGLLAVIAIPNFISYRNKSFCTVAEADASVIASQIAAYFAIPDHTDIDKTCISNAGLNNTNWDILSANPNQCITIIVHDDSGRCPADYQKAMPGWNNNVLTKAISNK